MRERFLLKYTGKQILAPGHQEHSQGRAFCVLVTEEQKGVCASLSRGDGASQCDWTRSGGGHSVRSPLLPRLHNSLSDSPKSARCDYQAEKRNQAATEKVSVIYSNPGSRFYVIIGMISQLAHNAQQAIVPLFTHLHTHTHIHTHSCSHTFSLLAEMAKKVLVFHSLRFS